MMTVVAFVLKGYPRLSETFVAQEIEALERRGLDILIVALRRPTDRKRHDLHRRIRAPIVYLPEYLRDDPVRVLRGLAKGLRNGRLRAAARVWLADLRRDPTASRVRRFGQAVVLAAELPSDVRWLHAHFIHTPASVTRYAALMLDLPFSISAHAKDVWTSPDWEKREKLLAARWTVTCSKMNLAHLEGLAPGADVELVYHGLDTSRFRPSPRRPNRDGSPGRGPVRIVTVARAVEKKGIDVLLQALARLPDRLDWRLEHLGAGPLLGAWRELARDLGIAERVRWYGEADGGEVAAVLREADLFCLPARVASDGDRDGLPNVILEAMATALPVVATRVAAIEEAVQDDVTGTLVEPDDPDALAAAIFDLARDPARRHAMGEMGRRVVQERYPIDRGIDRLALRFGLRPRLRRVA